MGLPQSYVHGPISWCYTFPISANLPANVSKINYHQGVTLGGVNKNMVSFQRYLTTSPHLLISSEWISPSIDSWEREGGGVGLRTKRLFPANEMIQ